MCPGIRIFMANFFISLQAKDFWPFQDPISSIFAIKDLQVSKLDLRKDHNQILNLWIEYEVVSTTSLIFD